MRSKSTIGSDRDRKGNSDICITSAEFSKTRTQLTNNQKSHYPTCSPDGQILERRYSNPRNRVLKGFSQEILADIRPKTRFLHSKSQYCTDALGFSSEGDIYTINKNGSGQTKLTHNLNAKRILFQSRFGAGGEIYIINADSSRSYLTGRNVISIPDRAWSPDGKQIVFSSSDKIARSRRRSSQSAIAASGKNPQTEGAKMTPEYCRG